MAIEVGGCHAQVMGLEGVEISDGVTELFAPVSGAGDEAPDGWINAAGLIEEQDQTDDLLVGLDDGPHFSEGAELPAVKAQDSVHLRAQVCVEQARPSD